jgi:hypothetical protein
VKNTLGSEHVGALKQLLPKQESESHCGGSHFEGRIGKSEAQRKAALIPMKIFPVSTEAVRLLRRRSKS